MTQEEDRRELLLRMYDQMFNDINRHIVVVWQCVGVIIAAFAVFVLTEKEVITLDVAATLILLLCGWLLEHLQDAGYWYNRNLVMIANIERQFLAMEDLKHIHYYFGKHRPDNVMLTHLRIQYVFGISVALVILVFHFVKQVIPGLYEPWAHFEVLRCLPYVLVVLIALRQINRKSYYLRKYTEFTDNSPGIPVTTEGVRYGEGHGFSKSQKDQKAGE